MMLMKSIVVDFRIQHDEKCFLEKLGYNVLACPPCKDLYNAVCGHPDMLIHIIDSNTIIVHKNMDSLFINNLIYLGKKVVLSNNPIESSYPYDIILNAVNLSNFLIHNLKYTDKAILNNLKDKKLINTKQGYTKCSTAIISENAIITSDKSIARSLYLEDIDILLLPPGDIILEGLSYGFIGGTCGLIEKDVIAFYGDLNYYKYGDEVLHFLEKHEVKPVFLRKGKLIDRGSILII